MGKVGALTAISTLSVLLAGCAQPTAQESSALAERAEAWQEAFNAGDIEAVAALYTEDARMLAPNAPMGTGREAVRADLQGLLDAGLTGTLETLETMVAGDLGYRVGTYVLNASDGSVTDEGKFIEIWRLVDGEWKISRDIYNSDRAPGPTGTYVMASHEVGDPDVWLAAWQDSEERRNGFAEHGAASVRVFQDPEKPGMTGLLIDVVDMDAFQAYLVSEEGAQAKAADTVIDKGMRILVEVSE
jgi:ketosteroid isomerase-like protein